MELPPQAPRNLRRYSNVSSRRKHRFAKRLRFLLLCLKTIDAFGSPAEKLLVALIQECIAQILPEGNRVFSCQQPKLHERTNAVSPCLRAGAAGP